MKLLHKLSLALACALLSGVAGAQALYNQIPFYPGSSDVLIAPATPAVHTVKSSAGNVLSVRCYNILSTPVYINFFDVASGSITLGTTSAKPKEMCPGNTAGDGFVISFPSPLQFATAINYSVSGGISLTDNTSITASSVIVNVEFN